MSQVEGHVDIPKDGRHPFAEHGLVPVLLEQALDLGRAYLGPMFEDGLHRPVLLDQFDGGLLPHAWNAGDVVGDVAHQRLEVDGLQRIEAVALTHPLRGIEDGLRHAPLAGQDVDLIRDQLQGVQVAGNNRAVQAPFARLPDQGADHIVGLDPTELVDGDAKCGHDVSRQGNLGAQLGRSRPPLGLVLGQLLVPEGAATKVKGSEHVIRVRLQGDQQHRGESVGGIYHPAVPVGQRGEGKIGPVDQRMPIYKNQPLRPRGFCH